MKIKFINHACLEIDVGKFTILMDPWFNGKVFNSSWSLLRETSIEEIDIKRLKYILISHEHPDHFSVDTLKNIAKQKNDIILLCPERQNTNLQKLVEENGILYWSLVNKERIEIEGLYITAVKQGTDAALILEIDNKVILNQNDAYLDQENSDWIKAKYPKIDYWFFQFSLAGYYGNATDPEAIRLRGHDFHIESFFKYQNKFNPKLSIPFASYVYFCKKYNNYLNKYRVKLSELLAISSKDIHIPFYGCYVEQPENNIDRWEEFFSKEGKDYSEVKEEKLLEAANKSFNSIRNGTIPGGLILKFYDNDKLFYINYADRRAQFILDKENKYAPYIAGILPMEELLYFFSYPWGADTLNITGCFEIINFPLWRWLLEYKDSLYVR